MKLKGETKAYKEENLDPKSLKRGRSERRWVNRRKRWGNEANKQRKEKGRRRKGEIEKEEEQKKIREKRRRRREERDSPLVTGCFQLWQPKLFGSGFGFLYELSGFSDPGSGFVLWVVFGFELYTWLHPGGVCLLLNLSMFIMVMLIDMLDIKKGQTWQ